MAHSTDSRASGFWPLAVVFALFVLFMYGKKQHRPVQLGGGLLLMLLPFFVHNGLWLGVASAALCAIVWGGVKAGL